MSSEKRDGIIVLTMVPSRAPPLVSTWYDIKGLGRFPHAAKLRKKKGKREEKREQAHVSTLVLMYDLYNFTNEKIFLLILSLLGEVGLGPLTNIVGDWFTQWKVVIGYYWASRARMGVRQARCPRRNTEWGTHSRVLTKGKRIRTTETRVSKLHFLEKELGHQEGKMRKMKWFRLCTQQLEGNTDLLTSSPDCSTCLFFNSLKSMIFVLCWLLQECFIISAFFVCFLT